jgi:hypothetical protein
MKIHCETIMVGQTNPSPKKKLFVSVWFQSPRSLSRKRYCETRYAESADSQFADKIAAGLVCGTARLLFRRCSRIILSPTG